MQKIIRTSIFQGSYYLHLAERKIIELTSFGCLYSLASMGKVPPHPSPYGDTKPPKLPLSGSLARKAPQGEGCIKVKKIKIDLYRLLVQTLSPKGKARERICVTVNIFR